MKKIFFATFLFIGCISAIAQPAFVKDSLDGFIEREMQRWQIPGLAIAIVKDGKVVMAKGYGVKAFDKTEKVNEFTLFQIASNSKAFTGTAIAQLHEEKKLHLDSLASKYLPYFKLYDSHSTALCTVKDLLTHRIGHGTFQGDFLNWGSTLSRKEIVVKMRDTKPKYPFRYTYGYCNAGYIAAGEIILATEGITWDGFPKNVTSNR
jgi:CubicO group peptidase (beta-lactamase class C family)